MKISIPSSTNNKDLGELQMNFEEEVLNRSHELPVVVDFWAPWCGPCQVLGPVIEKLADESDEKWALVKINVDIHQDLAGTYNVRGIPAVKMFSKGEVVAEFSGALPEQQIKAWLEQHIPDEKDIELDRIEEDIEKCNISQADKALRDILKADPEHPRASFLLGKMLFTNEPEEALKYFSFAEKKTEFLSDVLTLRKLAEILLFQKNTDILEEAPVKQEFVEALNNVSENKLDLALEKFISVIIKNKSYQNEAAREACIGIFVLLGSQHNITKKYRKRFDMALY